MEPSLWHSLLWCSRTVPYTSTESDSITQSVTPPRKGRWGRVQQSPTGAGGVRGSLPTEASGGSVVAAHRDQVSVPGSSFGARSRCFLEAPPIPPAPGLTKGSRGSTFKAQRWPRTQSSLILNGMYVWRSNCVVFKPKPYKVHRVW